MTTITTRLAQLPASSETNPRYSWVPVCQPLVKNDVSRRRQTPGPWSGTLMAQRWENAGHATQPRGRSAWARRRVSTVLSLTSNSGGCDRARRVVLDSRRRLLHWRGNDTDGSVLAAQGDVVVLQQLSTRCVWFPRLSKYDHPGPGPYPMVSATRSWG